VPTADDAVDEKHQTGDSTTAHQGSPTRPGAGCFRFRTRARPPSPGPRFSGTLIRRPSPHQKWAEQQTADDPADRDAHANGRGQIPIAAALIRLEDVGEIESVCGITAAPPNPITAAPRSNGQGVSA